MNTGEQKVKINSNAVGDCPICGKVEESCIHLLKCEHIEAETTRAAAVTKLKGDLRKLKTAPIITTVLIYKINQWFGNTGDRPPQIPDDEVGLQLSLAIEEQADIGWENFMKGRVSKKWGERHKYYTQRRYTGKTTDKSMKNGQRN